MDLFQRLREKAVEEHSSGEFPSWLLAEVLMIADRPDAYRAKADLVQMLVMQIGDFDPYAGTGCFGGSVGADTIRATIGKIVS
jgi:hypothetical protein